MSELTEADSMIIHMALDAPPDRHPIDRQHPRPGPQRFGEIGHPPGIALLPPPRRVPAPRSMERIRERHPHTT
jgi:hypothetical protein